ncbi:class I SAM-dependent methyltransferase [Streptomyces sp. SAI-170]|uniref:class I SAM-dependent methyltransferase n=1 Tax=Streptomyces sp. SAI-170 TaxID=3377729 RepID=UPI003C799D61
MTSFDASERRMWAGRADAYDATFARLCAHPVPALLDAAAVTTGTYVLDVGTGTGTAALAAQARGAKVRAVDADAGMARLARTRGIDAQEAALPELPFSDGEFDAVVANFVLNHVGRPRTALTELRRVLKPGGRLALTLWSPGRQAGMELFGRALQAAGVTPPPDLPRLDPAEDFPRTPEGVTGLLTEAGFTGAACAETRFTHRAGVEEWWSAAAAGLATIGLIVTAQDADTVVRIRSAYDVLAAAEYAGDGELVLEHGALLASAHA